MTTCRIGDECVTEVMRLIEVDPEPFVMTEEVFSGGKLTQIVAEPGPMQGPPIEYFIGREELLAFMFNNDFPPITDSAVIPLPGGALLLPTALFLLALLRKWIG